MEKFKISIYLSNLSEYMKGKENGKWITLPMEQNEIEDLLASILNDHRESIILDYHAPFYISSAENVLYLNQCMQRVIDVDSKIAEVIFSATDTIEEAIDAIENNNYILINVDEASKGWSNALSPEETYGMILNQNGYNTLFSKQIPDEMIDYIDFEKIFICLSANDGWQVVKKDDATYLVKIL